MDQVEHGGGEVWYGDVAPSGISERGQATNCSEVSTLLREEVDLGRQS